MYIYYYLVIYIYRLFPSGLHRDFDRPLVSPPRLLLSRRLQSRPLVSPRRLLSLCLRIPDFLPEDLLWNLLESLLASSSSLFNISIQIGGGFFG